MEIDGIDKNDNSDWPKALKMKQITLSCSLNELENVTKFFRETLEEFRTIKKGMGLCHEHYRDWDKTWTQESSDIAIYVDFGKEDKG